MPRIVAALFEDPARAEGALQALMEAGVARDRISLIGSDRDREVSSISGFRDLSAPAEPSSDVPGLSLPDEDRRLFAEGLRQGGALVMARIDGDDVVEAVRILDMFDPVDLDQRSSEAEGSASAGASGVDLGGPLAAGLGAGPGVTNTGAVPGMGSMRSGASDLGSSDPRMTGGSDVGNDGPGAEAGSGDRRSDERAGAPGVNELGHSGPTATPGMGMMGASEVDRTRAAEGTLGSSGAASDARQAGGVDPGSGSPASSEGRHEADLTAKRSPGPASTAGMPGSQAGRERGGREMGGTGRVRSYIRDVG